MLLPEREMGNCSSQWEGLLAATDAASDVASDQPGGNLASPSRGRRASSAGAAPSDQKGMSGGTYGM